MLQFQESRCPFPFLPRSNEWIPSPSPCMSPCQYLSVGVKNATLFVAPKAKGSKRFGRDRDTDRSNKNWRHRVQEQGDGAVAFRGASLAVGWRPVPKAIRPKV